MAGADVHLCDLCPQYRYPRDRPPTKREVVARWHHHYPAWPKRKLMVLAIEQYTHLYAQWVNLWKWRKPPEWMGGPVKLHELRPAGKPMFLPELTAWRRELRAKLERSLDGDSDVQ